jgi:hypothetical protein
MALAIVLTRSITISGHTEFDEASLPGVPDLNTLQASF